MDLNTELAFLARIQDLIHTRIQELDRNMQQRRLDDQAIATQIYDDGLAERDNAQAELANLNNELTQNQQLYSSEYREHQAYLKLKDSPYFAAIGFSYTSDPTDSENYRLGLMNISDPDDFTPYIIDWRSPLASVYYEHSRGPAEFVSPKGQVDGYLSEKKQVVIRNGQLLRLFDTDEEVQDEILQEILSESSSEYMHNIVATLQRDQNRLIRINPKVNLLIQGAAGSGKTSIAMHRAAYLLYRDPGLMAKNILLLTPNEQLSDYVSEVLPDLGEENARQQLWIDPFFEELSTREARFANMQTAIAPLEKRAAAARFELIDAMAAFTKEDEHLIFQAETIDIGDYVIPAEYILSLYEDNYAAYPPLLRGQQMIDNIKDYVVKNSADRGRNFGQARGEIESQLAGMYDDSSLNDLAQRFIKWLSRYPEWSALYGKESGTAKDDVYDEIDITVLTYLKLFYYGSQIDWPIRHLIIDEMQDITPLAHHLLIKLFPCPKTVLGDINQAILFPLDEAYLEKLAALYRQSATKLQEAQLLQAYRSTFEINEFSKAILDLDDVVSFERHGETVDIIELDNAGINEYRDALIAQAEALNQNGWQSAAIICRDETMMTFLDGILDQIDKQHAKWRLLTLAEAKGLEFDCVIVAHMDGETIDELQEAESENLKILEVRNRQVRWYVAATRALHKLVILSQSRVPDFIKDINK